MTNKLNLKAVSLSLAIIFSIIYLACAILFYLFPGQTLTFFSNMFHGIDLTIIAKKEPLSLSSVIIGLIETVLSVVILSAIFVLIYNYFIEKHIERKE